MPTNTMYFQCLLPIPASTTNNNGFYTDRIKIDDYYKPVLEAITYWSQNNLFFSNLKQKYNFKNTMNFQNV
jgi:hypothetical protein